MHYTSKGILYHVNCAAAVHIVYFECVNYTVTLNHPIELFLKLDRVALFRKETKMPTPLGILTHEEMEKKRRALFDTTHEHRDEYRAILLKIIPLLSDMFTTLLKESASVAPGKPSTYVSQGWSLKATEVSYVWHNERSGVIRLTLESPDPNVPSYNRAKIHFIHEDSDRAEEMEVIFHKMIDTRTRRQLLKMGMWDLRGSQHIGCTFIMFDGSAKAE